MRKTIIFPVEITMPPMLSVDNEQSHNKPSNERDDLMSDPSTILIPKKSSI
jgi:hypothetical protein